jgi:hypothetical protein
MLKKGILGAIVLATAAGGPAIYYAVPDYWKALRRQWSSSSETAAAQAALSAPLHENPAAEKAVPALEGTPAQNLAQVLRFDVSTGWVLRRWPRVSTGLAELPLQGYRVPLVTGTTETDLAGSLTYYFNAQQQVQRIAFQGTTGDPREVVRLLTARYKFARRLTNDPGLFVYEVSQPGGRPTSVLRIQSAPVIKSSEPRRRFEVELTLERPNA